MRFKLTTRSGSEYVVTHTCDGEDERWTLGGDNVATVVSDPLGDRAWPIYAPTPWPPVIGWGMQMTSLYYTEPEHPDRMPGGGKLTSEVEKIEQLDDV